MKLRQLLRSVCVDEFVKRNKIARFFCFRETQLIFSDDFTASTIRLLSKRLMNNLSSSTLHRFKAHKLSSLLNSAEIQSKS